MEKRDYYEVLSVDRAASAAELKKAYRKQALKFHPDRNQNDPQAENSFKEAAEAYEVLSDDRKRQIYDTYGHAGLNSQAGGAGFQDVNDIFSSFGSIFEDFFGFSGGARGGRRSARGADLRYDLVLEFEEAVFGVEKEIEFNRETICNPCNGSGAKPGTEKKKCGDCHGHGQVRRNQGFFSVSMVCPSCRGQGSVIAVPCGPCRGSGKSHEKKKVSVKVPPGVDSGVRLRVTGEGQVGPGGAGSNGDLFVFLEIQESKYFHRDGADIIVSKPISMTQAALGAQVKVKTLDGEKDVEVLPGTQYGHREILSGEGVPRLRGMGRGDFYIEYQVVVPKKLNKDQRVLLEKLAEISDHDVSSAGGFFNRIFRE